MKIVCSSSELKKALDTVSKAVPSRPTHPILGNILLVAKEDEIELTGFDLIMGIKTTLKAEVEEEGTITLPCKFFGDIVAKLPDTEISIEWDGEEESFVEIYGKAGKFKLRGVESSEYPELPTVIGNKVITLPSKSIKEGLYGTLFSVSNDDTKPILTGVHLVQTVDKLEFASTDGHRLSIVKTFQEEPFESEFTCTIPARALREVERLITDEQISLLFDESLISFKIENTTIVSRSLDGAYPNYHQLIPTVFSRSLVADRKELIEALERVAVFTDQKNNLVRFKISDNQVCIRTDSKELGNASVTIPIEFIGESIEIGFNYKYFIEGLKHLFSKEVRLQLNEATQPTIVTPLNGFDATYLVMPVQIRD